MQQLSLFSENAASETDASISSPAARRASPSRKQVNVSGKPMSDSSFLKCLELLEKSGQLGSSLRMFTDFLVRTMAERWTPYVHRWRILATKSNCIVFQRQRLRHLTSGIEYGLLDTYGREMPTELLPTPRASEADKSLRSLEGAKKEAERRPSTDLSTAVQLLPTPTRSDANGAELHGDGGPDLRTVISMLPTPTTNDATGGANKVIKKDGRFIRDAGGIEHSANLNSIVASIGTLVPTPTACDYKGATKQRIADGNPRRQLDCEIEVIGNRSPEEEGGLRLQPAFEEWMMGYPLNWTSLHAPPEAKQTIVPFLAASAEDMARELCVQTSEHVIETSVGTVYRPRTPRERKAAIMQLGNTIVPEIALMLFDAIEHVENSKGRGQNA